jgi:hypothetical protein
MDMINGGLFGWTWFKHLLSSFVVLSFTQVTPIDGVLDLDCTVSFVIYPRLAVQNIGFWRVYSWLCM